MNEEHRASSFDELARGLASGSVTRGKALKWMIAALGGGTLASLPGVAWAKSGGDRGKCPYPGQIKVCQCPSGQELCGGACVQSCGPGYQLNQTCQCEVIINNVTCVCSTGQITACGQVDCQDGLAALTSFCTQACASQLQGGFVGVQSCTAGCPNG